jgi:hypothetical protein
MTPGEPSPMPPRIENIEIYIDPDGSVTITDLPVELLPLYESLQRSLTHGLEEPQGGG